MEYREGRIGRLFSIVFRDGEDPLEGIKAVAMEKEVRVGWFFLIGGLREGSVVTGPEEPVIPPQPVWKEFRNDAREILATGTIVWNDHEPMLHLHAAMARGDDTNVGCLRRDARAFLIMEALVIEVDGLDLRRRLDERSGLFLASFM